MQTLLTMAMLALASTTGLQPAPGGSGDAQIHLAQFTLKWSGSWIWTPENRKWVDPDNHSSIELLQGNNARFCFYASCWTVKYAQTKEIYSFNLPSTKAYYEFWLGDFNALEGRFWLDKSKRQGAPDAMIRMMSE